MFLLKRIPLRRKKEKKVGLSLIWVVIHFFLLVFIISSLFPLYYLCTNTFKTEIEFACSSFSLPSSLNISNIIEAWIKGGFFVGFMNSSLISGVSVLLQLLLGSLAAYAFAKMDFKGKDYLHLFTISSMFIPLMVIMIPLYLQMSSLGLLNTYAGIFIIYGGLLAFTIYILTAFFKGIPNELLDAAKIDGCSDLKILFEIVLPLAKPAILTISVMNFLAVWSDFLIPLIFLQEERMWTLMLTVVGFQTMRTYTPMVVMVSGLFIVTVPVIIFYLLAQKHFIKGLVMGSFR